MPSQAFCTGCGTPTRSGVSFCTSCGRPTQHAKTTGPAAPVAATITAARAAPPQAPAVQAATPLAATAPPTALPPPPVIVTTPAAPAPPTAPAARPAPPQAPRPASSTSKGQLVGGAIVETGAALYTLIKVGLAIFAIAVIAGGYFYDHSPEFKLKCIAHKAGGYDIGAIQNLICDLDFTLK